MTVVKHWLLGGWYTRD